MSEKKIGFFGETPVPEGEWIQVMGQDLFDRVRRLGEDRDAWVERARQAEAERDDAHASAEASRRSMYALEERVCQLRAALERYGHHESGPDGCRYEGEGFGGAPCTCGLAEALKG